MDPEQYADWMAKGKEMARAMHLQIAKEVLAMDIEQGKETLGPLIGHLAEAMEKSETMQRFSSLPFHIRLMIIRAGVMGLMHVQMDIITRITEAELSETVAGM